MFVAVSHRKRQLLARRPALGPALCAFSAALAFSGTAPALSPDTLDLDVTRTAEASDCPEAGRLRELVSAAASKSFAQQIHLEVSFERVGERYTAVVRASGARSGVRALSVTEAHCAPLVDALIVSILVLLDPDAEGIDEPSPEAEPARAHSPVAPVRPAATPKTVALPQPSTDRARIARSAVQASDPSDSTAVHVAVAASPTLALGLTPSVTAGTELGLSAHRGVLAGSFNVSAFLPRDTQFGEGRVTAWFAAARASLCARLPVTRKLATETCMTGLAARLSVRGHGYFEDHSAVRPLWAVGPEVALSGELGGTWGWFARGAVLIAPSRESFSIAGEAAGEAFRVAVVNGWLGAGVWMTIH